MSTYEGNESFGTRLARRVSLVEQELLTLPEHMSSPEFTVVGGDKDGELLYMAPWSPLFCLKTKFHHRRNGRI
jgi:hypothetical protein